MAQYVTTPAAILQDINTLYTFNDALLLGSTDLNVDESSDDAERLLMNSACLAVNPPAPANCASIFNGVLAQGMYAAVLKFTVDAKIVLTTINTTVAQGNGKLTKDAVKALLTSDTMRFLTRIDDEYLFFLFDSATVRVTAGVGVGVGEGVSVSVGVQWSGVGMGASGRSQIRKSCH